jgi:hypothetical protein
VVDDGSSVAAAPAGGGEVLGATGGGARSSSRQDNHGFTKARSPAKLLPSASRVDDTGVGSGRGSRGGGFVTVDLMVESGGGGSGGRGLGGGGPT